MDVPRFGMTVAPADKVEGAGKQGVVVTKVDPKGAAADRGFKKGDVILGVPEKAWRDTTTVTNVEAARADERDGALMRPPFRRRVPLRRRAARKRLKKQEIGGGFHGHFVADHWLDYFCCLGAPPEGFALDLFSHRIMG